MRRLAERFARVDDAVCTRLQPVTAVAAVNVLDHLFDGREALSSGKEHLHICLNAGVGETFFGLSRQDSFLINFSDMMPFRGHFVG